MVSLRRRKKSEEMNQGGQRRSARLLALEELKNEKAVLALPVDFQHMKGGGHLNLRKRGCRKKETQVPQDIDENIDGNPVNSPPALRKTTDRIIGYILDMLEVKDTHELFCMPDNLQMHDYRESMSKPGDFATLRQKQTDGMYTTTLEQFENDVYTVFQKAIDSNSPDSIPFREAITLRDHAKQIFQSLKNNLPYAELELSQWHQNYFNYKRRPQKNVSYVGNCSNYPQPEHSSRIGVPSEITRNTGAANNGAYGRQYSMGIRKHSPHKDSFRPIGRRGDYHPTAASREDKLPQSFEEQRRNSAHKPWSDSDELSFAMLCSEPRPLIYNNNTLCYQESVRRFVKDAGPVAKLVGERKCVEYSKRVRAQSIWRSPPFGSQSKFGLNSSTSNNYGSSSTNCFSFTTDTAPKSCDKIEKRTTRQPHTDELLTLFSLIGTPEFSQRSSAVSTKQDVDSEWGFTSFLQGVVAIQSCVSSAKQTGNPEVPKSIWQPQFGCPKP